MPHNETSKQEKVKRHLQRGKSITGLQAIERFDVYRLSSIINRLRKSPHFMNIKTSLVGDTNYAKYSLIK